MGRPNLDLSEGGSSLVTELRGYARRRDVVVLALKAGTVPLAAEVAQRLQAPLDLFLVRPLVVYERGLLEIGAIASGGVLILDPDAIKAHGLPASSIATAAQAEARELERHESVYRGGQTPLDLRNHKAIVIDDGCSGASLLRVVSVALRRRWAARVILACPTMPAAVFRELFRDADEIVTAVTDQATDERATALDGTPISPAEVSRLLRRSAIPAPRTMPAYQVDHRPVDISHPLAG
jgi:predicted phosphoribosyltransferase